MKHKIIFLSIATLLFNACKPLIKETSMTNRNIDSDWMFRQVGTEKWMPAEVPGTVHTDLMKNEVIENPFYRLNEHANTSIKIFEELQETILKNANPENALLHVRFTDNNNAILSENILYFTPVKELELPKPEIKTSIEQAENGFALTVSTNVLAKNIYFTTPGMDVFFTDNYFDILPGEEKTIFIKGTNASPEAITETLQWVTLVDSY